MHLEALTNEGKLVFPLPSISKLTALRGQSSLDIPELIATKAYTIGRRGTFKDYVDIYFAFTEHHTSLENVIALAEKKYGTSFNARLFLEQLVYFDDISDTEIQFLKQPASKKHIQEFFQSEVKKILI